jgi:hypothetical protein
VFAAFGAKVQQDGGSIPTDDQSAALCGQEFKRAKKDTSGKSPADFHHRKNFETRSESPRREPAAGFFI